MANIKASEKSIRQTATRTAHNKTVKTRIKTLGKKVAELAKGGDLERVKAAASAFVSAVDKAAKRGIVHKNKADRSKSAVSKYLFTK